MRVFPGWLVSRRQYKGEWEAAWPATHWDHWLRDPARRKGRECVFPELSRNYNIGVHGTHSNDALFSRYFREIHHHTEGSATVFTPVNALVLANYDAELVQLLRASKQMRAVAEFNTLPNPTNPLLSLFYAATSSADVMWEKTVAPFFGLWHSIPFIRGVHKGVHRLWFKGHYVFLVAQYSPLAPVVKQHETPFLKAADFTVAVDANVALTVVTAPADTSCEIACSAHAPQLKCDVGGLARINNCDTLKLHFKCVQCDYSSGPDQPAMRNVRVGIFLFFCLLLL